MKEEKREEQEKKEEREWQEEQDKKTKGKEAMVDKGKKLERGRLIFRKEGTKGCSSLMWITGKIDERRSRLSQIVQVLLLHRGGKRKTKWSKLLTIEKAKNDAHLHKGTTAWTTGLNKALRKEG